MCRLLFRDVGFLSRFDSGFNDRFDGGFYDGLNGRFRLVRCFVVCLVGSFLVKFLQFISQFLQTLGSIQFRLVNQEFHLRETKSIQ